MCILEVWNCESQMIVAFSIDCIVLWVCESNNLAFYRRNWSRLSERDNLGCIDLLYMRGCAVDHCIC